MSSLKNLVLPTYEASYDNMNKALSNGDIDAPCWVFISDRDCLAFIHWEKEGNIRVLKPRLILWEKVSEMSEQMEGLVDPDTGEPIPVTDYVTETVAPIEENLNTVTTDVDEIKEQVGYVSMLISSDNNEEVG